MTKKEDAQPIRVQGEITGVEASRLTVRTRDGGEQRFALSPDVKVFTLAPAKADAVAMESSIGASGEQQQTERIKASIVVIYPQGSAGTSEDYLAWNLAPEGTMRNGVVRSVENGPDGRIVGLSYPQGGATVVIPTDASVMTLVQADKSLLKKGAQIIVPSAEKGSNGDLTAEVVAVGKDGFKPPM